jgi:hypothetical protein
MRVLLRQTCATLIVIVGSSGAAGISAQTPSLPPIDQGTPMLRELVATQDFQRRVDDYVALHRLLEGLLPPLRPTRDIGEIQRLTKALSTRIQAARPNAQPGDIITAEVGRIFQRRIVTCLSPEAWFAILAEGDDDETEGVRVPMVTLRVNMPWPEGVPYGFVPPQLLAALPLLPRELQYRIIGRSLVLWDHHADLIVDFLPGAFASTT